MIFGSTSERPQTAKSTNTESRPTEDSKESNRIEVDADSAFRKTQEFKLSLFKEKVLGNIIKGLTIVIFKFNNLLML